MDAFLQAEKLIIHNRVYMSHFLEVHGAKKHNLKNISVKIPKNKLTTITGVSGTGKSSLAFDTIYAEGQRRYLESLSTYARMIIAGGHEETMVDEIRGLSPTISINQKTVSANPRSTVGTITEIYDFYRLLFLHTGVQKCPKHGIPLEKSTIAEITAFLRDQSAKTRFLICAPILLDEKKMTFEQIKQEVLGLGFIRYMINDTVYALADAVSGDVPTGSKIFVVVDRLVIEESMDDATIKRMKDSLDVAYKVGNDFLTIVFPDESRQELFSRQSACPKCQYRSQDLTLSNFSFNSHL